MRRLYVRIFAALLATALLSSGAFFAIFVQLTVPTVERLILGLQTVTLAEALGALQESGPASAAARLESRGVITNSAHFLVDGSGRDILTGTDRSALLSAADHRIQDVLARDRRMAFVRASDDGRYRLITLTTPPFGLFDILPYYLLLLLAVGTLCAVLAVDIVSPMRKIAAAIDEFGRGKLAARTGVRRDDEIGALARAVDDLGRRLELLVTAERRLLQDVSHELRSPLTRLNLNLELSRTAPDREAAASRLQRDLDRLSRLIGSLLDMTRLEGERLDSANAPVDLAALVAEVVADCGFEAQARDVRLNTTIANAVVPGDAELLRRAVENVLRNAIRYAPARTEVETTVAVEGDTVVLTVRDFGPGVPPELLDRLGTPFFRVERSRDAASGGAGLGLAIARRAIDRHAGTWHVENAGPGLRVRMLVPLRAQSGTDVAATLASPRPIGFRPDRD